MNENSDRDQAEQAASTVTSAPKVSEPRSYNGWLVSDDLIKRSIAIFLHGLLGQLIILVPIVILLTFLSVILSSANVAGA